MAMSDAKRRERDCNRSDPVKLTKRAINSRVEAAFKTHGSHVQFDMMDLSKLMDAGRNALLAGSDLDAAMIAAVAEYRKN